MHIKLGAIGLVVLSLACGAPGPSGAPGGPSSPVPSSPGPSAATALVADLSVNGVKLGSFSCHAGMFFAASVTNVSSVPVRLERLTIQFMPTTGPCRAFPAQIDPHVATHLAPGASALVRSFDGAGALCEAPNTPGCTWTATAELASDSGTARDQLGFSTYGVSPSQGCEGAVPRVAAPRDGDVVSGITDVTASVVESRYCVMSARTIVQAFSERGELIFSSRELDLGDRVHWDTRAVRNGRYALTAQQNCCRIPSIPIYVTVRN